jgi:hypothetical protein
MVVYASVIDENSPLTKPMQRTAQARFYVEGVLPGAVSEIAAIWAGKVYFHRRDVLCSASSYGMGYKCSR